MVTVTVLIEETSLKHNIAHEHGLSLYIKTPCHKLLFDTGASPKFIENAHQLGIDLSQVDTAVISHGHYDHAGGLNSFLNVNSKADIYVNEHFFGDYWANDGRYVGVDPSLKSNNRIKLLSDRYDIDDELSIFSGNRQKRPFKMDSFGLLKRSLQKTLPDDFLHEHYLMIKDDDAPVLVSGCSHKGILNILSWCPKEPRAVIGGLHLMKLDTTGSGAVFLNATAQELIKSSAVFYTCHCTGLQQYAFLKEAMGDKINYIHSGETFHI